LQYAIRLFQLPLGVFAVSISSAILPRLSAAADDTELADMVKKGIQMCAFWLLPATAGLYVLGKPIIQLLFEHGSFSHADTLRTWYALKYYLVGMIGYGLVYVLTRAFYSKGDTKTPVWIGALAVIINIILNYALIGPMREGGLALATSIAGLVNMALLGVVLQQRLKVSLVVNLGQMALASALMGALTYLFYRWLASFLGNELLLAGLPLLFGILAYLAFSKLGGFLLIRR
jgi:putative peptidoglycan lipid II flippase